MFRMTFKLNYNVYSLLIVTFSSLVNRTKQEIIFAFEIIFRAKKNSSFLTKLNKKKNRISCGH